MLLVFVTVPCFVHVLNSCIIPLDFVPTDSPCYKHVTNNIKKQNQHYLKPRIAGKFHNQFYKNSIACIVFTVCSPQTSFIRTIISH